MSASVLDVTVTADYANVAGSLAVYEGVPGQVSVMYLAHQGAAPTYTAYDTTPDDLARAARDVVKADTADEPLGIYVRGTTVSPGVTGRGTSDDTVSWVAFRADLDLGKPGGPATWPELFAAFATANVPTPSYWQHSGGGFYPTWQLAEPVPHGPEPVALAVDIEAELRRAWNAAGYRAGVDSCRDAARVWRLAGSVHRKNPAAPILSTIGHVSGEVRTLAQLRALVPVAPAARTWDGVRTDPRRDTAERFEATYRKHLDAVRDRGLADFRHTFFVAARDTHRMVAIGRRTKDQARAELTALVDLYWPNAGLNGDDLAHVAAALHNGLDKGDSAGANASPWELITVQEQPLPSVNGAGQVSDGVQVGQDGSGTEPVVEEVDSWRPMDLTAYVDGTVKRAEMSVGARRRDGLRFLYPGLEHAVIGETEGGKTWFLLACAAAELVEGNRVVYVHFEENDPGSTVRRLIDQFRVPAARVLDDFLFIGPERQVPPGRIDDMCAERVPSLVVLDGQNEAMALHDQGINDPDGAAEFRRRLVKPWTRHGAAVASADHVVKDPDRNGNGYALGSVHKLNGLSGAGFLVENREAFGEGMRGNSGIYVVKDRPGRLRKAGTATRVARKYHLAEMVIDDTGDLWTMTLHAPATDDGPDAEFEAMRQTRASNALMDEVVSAVQRLLDDEYGRAKTLEIVDVVGKRKADVVQALTSAVEAGLLVREEAPRGGRSYGLPTRSHDPQSQQA